MTQSDITIERLADVGAGDAAYLVSKIRTIPGFPKEGIKFRDFMPVLADGKGLRILMKALQASLPVTEDSFDAVAGLEARGFLFGPALAAMLGKGSSRSARRASCRRRPSPKNTISNTAPKKWRSRRRPSVRAIGC